MQNQNSIVTCQNLECTFHMYVATCYTPGIPPAVLQKRAAYQEVAQYARNGEDKAWTECPPTQTNAPSAGAPSDKPGGR